MKKNKLLIIIPILLLIFVTGCSTNKKEKKLECSLNVENENENYKISLERVAYYDKNKNVTRTVSNDIVESTDYNTLDTYEKQFNSVKNMYKGIKYYDVTVSQNGNKVEAVTKVDYTKVDTNALIKVTNNNNFFEKDGTLRLSTLKKSYEDSGLTCK